MITPKPFGAPEPERVPLPGAPESLEPSEMPSAPPSSELPVPPHSDEYSSGGAVFPTVPAQTIASAEQERQEIEAILSEGLEAEYRSLDPARQQKFRQEGERIASAIQTLLVGSKKAAKRMYALILQWLGMIPGVNRYFLQQEAKIKTDRILSLRRM